MGFLPDRSEVVLRHLLERNAEEVPRKECILFEEGDSWTYEEGLKQAYQAANALSEIGIQRGENVLVFLPNTKDWIRSWWGITTLGAVVVPVNTSFKGEMLKHAFQEIHANYVITTPDLGEKIQGLDLDITLIDPSTLTEGSGNEPKLERPIEPWDIHTLIFTSGSTGRSKAVNTPYFHLYMAGIPWWSRATSDDTFLAMFPNYHTSGMVPLISFWSKKGRIALRKAFSASQYLDTVRKCRVTIGLLIGTMPEFVASMLPLPDDADNPLRAVMSIPMVKDPDAFKRRFGVEELISVYGSTDVSIPIMTMGPDANIQSLGTVRKGIQVRVVDDHDIPVPTGKVGELIIRTDRPWEMNAGYYGRPEQTAYAWRNGWFNTEDLVTCDNEGNYYLVGRKKDAIRRRGENISSFEVEREVMAHHNILEAACVGVPAKFGEDEVKVFVVPRKMEQFDPVELIEFLIPRMPYFMVPRFVEAVPELPKTHTDRIKKYELREWGNSENTWDREAAGIILKRDR